ncbi:MAG: putative transcriptional regulator, PucR family, partial [Klenkia sp.]|nr:putative transcriptional regulator, PucR family [Klenkia sp.]
AAAERSTAARDALQSQIAVLGRASQLQQDLLRTVVEGGGLPAIARAVSEELGCEVGVYGPDGELVTVHRDPGGTEVLPEVIRVRHRTGRRPHQDDRVWARPVYADGDEFGQVLLVQDGHADELLEAVAGQVAMACSLALMRERAASRARAEAAEQVLWDLLHGPLDHRLAARSRAQQLNVTLTGGLRVLHGHIENIGSLALDQAWGAAKTDRVRRQVLRSVKALQGRDLTLASLRGDLVVAVVAGLDPDGAKSLVTALSAVIHDELPELKVAWGVSRAHEDLMDLPSGLNEARTALAAARRLGGQTVFLYEELGIVRLLLGSGDDPDLQTFVREVTGPLLAYDRDNDGSLIRTLRAFFDADCSQRVASERLFVHHKTLRYRLERIRELTGLNLARHEDRMRADFALRLLQVSRSGDEAGDTGESPV